MKNKIILLFCGTLFLASCSSDDDVPFQNPFDTELRNLLAENSPTGDLSFYILPSENNLQSIPQDIRNPLTEKKVELGKMLFHETGIGVTNKVYKGNKTFSCASCHQSKAGFQSGLAQGIGEGGIGFGVNGESRVFDPSYNLDSIDVQPIRTPTIINGAFQTNMLWNGQFGATGRNIGTESSWTEGTPKEVNHLGYEGLETQAIAGMNVHRLDVNRSLLDSLGYLALFDEVFAEFNAEERYTRETAGLAIAAYERTVLSNKAPFQDWLKGDLLLSNDELKGALLFFDKANCNKCHNGPALNQMSFHAIGMHDLPPSDDIYVANPENPEKRGRGGFTGRDEDNFKFKVPQLYNLKEVGFFGHGSSFHTIRDVIEYKNEAIPENEDVDINQISELFVPLNLTDEEIEQINAFITNSLFDPNIERYVPESLLSGNCFPNADALSRADLGCE